MTIPESIEVAIAVGGAMGGIVSVLWRIILSPHIKEISQNVFNAGMSAHKAEVKESMDGIRAHLNTVYVGREEFDELQNDSSRKWGGQEEINKRLLEAATTLTVDVKELLRRVR